MLSILLIILCCAPESADSRDVVRSLWLHKIVSKQILILYCRILADGGNSKIDVTQGVLVSKFPHCHMNVDPGPIQVSKSPKNIERSCTSLKFCNHASEFEKNSKITKILPKKIFFFSMKFDLVLKGTLFRVLFVHP